MRYFSETFLNGLVFLSLVAALVLALVTVVSFGIGLSDLILYSTAVLSTATGFCKRTVRED